MALGRCWNHRRSSHFMVSALLSVRSPFRVGLASQERIRHARNQTPRRGSCCRGYPDSVSASSNVAPLRHLPRLLVVDVLEGIEAVLERVEYARPRHVRDFVVYEKIPAFGQFNVSRESVSMKRCKRPHCLGPQGRIIANSRCPVVC
jgi:hypothetical protein